MPASAEQPGSARAGHRPGRGAPGAHRLVHGGVRAGGAPPASRSSTRGRPARSQCQPPNGTAAAAAASAGWPGAADPLIEPGPGRQISGRRSHVRGFPFPASRLLQCHLDWSSVTQTGRHSFRVTPASRGHCSARGRVQVAGGSRWGPSGRALDLRNCSLMLHDDPVPGLYSSARGPEGALASDDGVIMFRAGTKSRLAFLSGHCKLARSRAEA